MQAGHSISDGFSDTIGFTVAINVIWSYNVLYVTIISNNSQSVVVGSVAVDEVVVAGKIDFVMSHRICVNRA